MLDQVALPVALLYAELHDLAVAEEARERREGSFSVKRINDRNYWYHQTWIGRTRHQKFLGPETPELLNQIATWKQEASVWRAQNRRRAQLVRSLKAAMKMSTDALSGKVLARLSELGVFKAGAVLIGTHAYTVYGPLLGVRLAQSNLRTGDIDFGVGNVDVAAADTFSFSEAVQSADNAFFVVPPSPGSRISTALKYKGGEARVELLTPLRKGAPWKAEVIGKLNFGAQRAPFLDYLIENPIEATYLSGAGVAVVVPDPARFAWHKLIVAANRDASRHTKAIKDVAQATELLNALAQQRPKDLEKAAALLIRRGGAYLKKTQEGFARLDPATRDIARRYLSK